MKKLVETAKVLKELNSPKTYSDGETLQSQFNFVLRIEQNVVRIFDCNECYNINYLEEQNCLMEECADEFGYKFEPVKEDMIYNKIQEALKKDLGNEHILDWDTNVEMVCSL